MIFIHVESITIYSDRQNYLEYNTIGCNFIGVKNWWLIEKLKVFNFSIYQQILIDRSISLFFNQCVCPD